MDSTTVMLMVGGAVALIAGPLTARSSERRDMVYGGFLARVLNLIACMGFVAILPTVLTGLLSGHGVAILPIGFGILGITLLASFAFGFIEGPARERAPKVVRTALNQWTEEDARKSGL